MFHRVPENIRLSPQNFNTQFGPQPNNAFNSFCPPGSNIYVPPAVSVQPPNQQMYYFQPKPENNFAAPTAEYSNQVPNGNLKIILIHFKIILI